jgi:tripeptide aminopeptidase
MPIMLQDGRDQMINETRLLETFLDLVRIDSPSGEEATIALELVKRLRHLGLTVELDPMNNVVAKLPGQGAPVLLAAHMDTVMPGCGVEPVVKDGVVHSDGTTILGADDKAGVAVILELLQTIVEHDLPRPSLEVVITVQEESGLEGAKALDKSRLQARVGISLDAGDFPGRIVVSAPSHNLVSATIHGKAAHAGGRPEEGVNAIVVAAEAVVDMPLGRIDAETTANIGLIKGGTARNVVPDRVELGGEARSRQLAKLEAQTARMVKAFQEAAQRHGATVDVETRRAYDGYTLTEADPVVCRLMTACRAAGVEPALVPSGGGSDANIFNAQGMQVVNLSTGIHKEHTTEEHIALADMVICAQIALEFIGDLSN